jgi:hypoxanthine phosphoribosyltransferase
MTKTVSIQDKTFRISINYADIQDAVTKVANSLNNDFKEKQVIFLVVLNGAFMFASDLIKLIDLNCMVSFLKLASYDGMERKREINNLIGLNEDLKDKTVIILEDIVDSGNSLNSIITQLNNYKPKSIRTAALLFKPNAYLFSDKPDYIGFEIADDFVVGYGLDYNGYGRNLNHIYKVEK